MIVLFSSLAYAEDDFVLEVDKTNVNPGDNITFSAEIEGVNVRAILSDNDNLSMEDDQAPYEWSVQISEYGSGAKEYFVMALLDDDVLFSNKVKIVIMPDLETLQSIIFDPNNPVWISPNSTRQLKIMGNFSDGHIRVLTESAVGTVYTENIVNGLTVIPGDSPAIEVSEDGLLTAVTPGVAEVVATNSGKVAILRVTVEAEEGEDYCPDDLDKTVPGICGCGVADTDTDGDNTPDCQDNCPDDPNKIEPGSRGCNVSAAYAGDDQSVTEGDEVTLDGTESDIAIDEFILYTWKQTSGNEVTLSDANDDQPTFTTPDVAYGGETLVFELTITDVNGIT